MVSPVSGSLLLWVNLEANWASKQVPVAYMAPYSKHAAHLLPNPYIAVLDFTASYSRHAAHALPNVYIKVLDYVSNKDSFSMWYVALNTVKIFNKTVTVQQTWQKNELVLQLVLTVSRSWCNSWCIGMKKCMNAKINPIIYVKFSNRKNMTSSYIGSHHDSNLEY